MDLLQEKSEEFFNKVLSEIKNNNKTVILIAGASASGKSFIASNLKKYLNNNGINSFSFSADNYYKGISTILVEKAFIQNAKILPLINKKQEIINTLKSVIEKSPFPEKFNKENLNLLTKNFDKYGSLSHELGNELKLQFEKINFDEPFALNLQKLNRDINKLIKGKDIILPEYSFSSGEPRINNKNIINGGAVYIIEGLYCLRPEVLNGLNENKILTCFIECDLKTLLSRRFNRDIKQGRTTFSAEQTISSTLTKTMPSYIVNILPYKHNAKIKLNTSLTTSEILTKEKINQIKYSLNQTQLIALKKLNPEVLKSKIQDDYFFADNNNDNSNNFILRVRFEDDLPSKISFKINLNNSCLIEEYDISKLNLNKTELINNFKNSGLYVQKNIIKQRTFFRYKNEEFKLDKFLNLNNYYLEMDNSNCYNLINKIKGQYINILNNLNAPKINNKHLHKEKEFKFIIDKIPKNTQKMIKIHQFYFNFINKKEFLINKFNFNLSSVSSARVRIAKENNITKYILTLKSSGNFEREEQEIEISKQDAILLLKNNIISQIKKTRYILKYKKLTLEFDEYENGLKIVEIEVKNNKNYENIIKILNILNLKFKDVTNNENYKNENLAQCLLKN